VLAVGAPLISEGLADDRESVRASETASPVGAPVEVPRLVEVHCTAEGIVVPVASVRPQRDGLHIRVLNSLPASTTIEVESDDWASGRVVVPRGVHDVRQPVPPGQLTIGCTIAGAVERRQVDLVDPNGFYRAPELACDESERDTLTDLPVDPPNRNMIAAARTGLDPHLVGGADDDAVGALRGYPAQRLNDPTDDPVVQVVRDGDVIAFAHMRGEDGSVLPPWTTVSALEVCSSAVGDAAPPESPATTSSTEPPAGGTDPPD